MTFVTDTHFCISPPPPTHTYTHFKMLNSMPYFSVVVRSHWRLQQVTLLMYYYCHYSSNSFFRSYEIWIMNRIWISTYFLCYVNGLAEVHQNRLVVCSWLFCFKPLGTSYIQARKRALSTDLFIWCDLCQDKSLVWKLFFSQDILTLMKIIF